MNAAEIEKRLRDLSLPELPEAWRAGIVSTALREAQKAQSDVRVWPPILILLRNLLARNPVTAMALALMWILIVAFRVTTPVDPAEKAMLAHFDPNRPVYVVSLREQIELAELLENPAPPAPPTRIP